MVDLLSREAGVEFGVFFFFPDPLKVCGDLSTINQEMSPFQ